MNGLEISGLLNIGVLEWGAGVILLLSLIQIAPIRINPWSWIAKKLGAALNQEVLKKLNEVNKRINDQEEKVNDQIEDLKQDVEHLQDKIEEKDALSIRRRILHFNRELVKGELHTEEEYNEILDDITAYEKYCLEHPQFPNKKAVFAEENIHKSYKERLDKRDFL